MNVRHEIYHRLLMSAVDRVMGFSPRTAERLYERKKLRPFGANRPG